MNLRDGERLMRGGAWVVYLAVAWAGGGVAMWIAPWQRWAVVAGGVVFALALLTTLLPRSGRASPPAEPGMGDRRDDRWAAFDALRDSLVHLVPAFLLAVLGVTTLASQALQRAEITPGGNRQASTELEAQPGDVSLGQLAVKPVPGRVQTIGMVFRPDAQQVASLSGAPDPRHIPLLLYRFEITCCAADALPRAVILTGVDPAAYEADTWVRVQGSLTPGALMGHPTGGMAVLEAVSVERIPEPQHPFLERKPW